MSLYVALANYKHIVINRISQFHNFFFDIVFSSIMWDSLMFSFTPVLCKPHISPFQSMLGLLWI